ncbi:MAG: ATP-binding protein [Candidatus Melainabacteria bacterium]|nr:ATP-binding protein [Candidatus Melainabacteria bacterium]
MNDRKNGQAPEVMTADRLGQMLTPRQGKQRLVLMVGIPGSGKSTVGDGIEKAGYVRISYDVIRQRLFGDAKEHGEEGQVGRAFREELRAVLTSGKSVLVDNTNFLKDMRTHIIEIARQCGVGDVHLVVMKVPLPLCLERNRARDRVVPTRTVRHMHWKLTGSEWPTREEGRMTIVRPGLRADSGVPTYLVGGFAFAVACTN